MRKVKLVCDVCFEEFEVPKDEVHKYVLCPVCQSYVCPECLKEAEREAERWRKSRTDTRR